MGTNRVKQFMRMVTMFGLAVCAGCASGNVSPAIVSPSAVRVASEDGTILLDGYGQGGNVPPDLVRYEFKLQNDKFILVKKLPGVK